MNLKIKSVFVLRREALRRKEMVKRGRSVVLYCQKRRFLKNLKRKARFQERRIDREVGLFRRYCLVKSVFKLLKWNYVQGLRQKYLFKGIEKLVYRRKLRLAEEAMDSLKLNLLCSKYQKMREMKLKYRIFTLLRIS